MAQSRKHLRANCRVLGDGSLPHDHSHVSRKPRTKRALVDQAPAFEDADHKTTSTDARYPGYDRSWEKAAKLVSPQGDGKPGPATPVSGGQTNTPQKRRYSTIDKYVGGKNYDPINSRVSDEGKSWVATEAPAPIQETPSNVKVASPDDDAHVSVTTPKKLDVKRGERPREEVPRGWEKRYAKEIREHSLAEGMTSSGTPQRKKLRESEDGH